MLAAGLILMLSAAPAAHAQQDTGGSRAKDVAAGAFDLLVLRPMGVAGMGAGLVFFVASAPFVAPSGNISETFDIFLYAPFEYTFVRPLGVF